MKQKNHFFVLLFALILFFFSGCQEETPVSPMEGVSLEKVRVIEVSGNVTASDLCGYQDIELSWAAVRKTVFYRVTYQKATTGKEVIQELGPNQLSAVCTLAIRQEDGRGASVFVQAFKMRKDTPILIATIYKNFTYSGTSVVNNQLFGMLSNYEDHADFYATWDWSNEINNIDHYYYEFYCTWETEEHSGTTATPVVYYSPTDHQASYGEMVRLVVWAYDTEGNCLGSGYAGFHL